MSTNQSHDSNAITEAHRRLETIKEDHKQQMFKEGEVVGDGKKDQIIGVATNSRHRLIADICEEIQELFPEPEPESVRRFRALVLSMDTVRSSERTDPERTTGEPLRVLQNVAIEYRDEAIGAIENRLELERPADDEDADVIYIYDPVSKIRHTTALGGYSAEYDYAMIEDQKYSLAEQILYEPIPDSIPRV